MRMFLTEYSLAVMYSISVIAVLTIVFFTMNNDKMGIVFTFNTNMIYSNDFCGGTDATSKPLAEHEASGKFDSVDEVKNTTASIHKPTFTVDSSVVNDDYIIEIPTLAEGVSKTYYTYDELLNLFSAKGKIQLNLWDGSKYVSKGLPNSVEIVITKLSPTTRGADGSIVTEWVESTDKYSNVILDGTGKPIMVEQVVYQEEVFNRTNISDFYIDWDEACRYRVLFRYTDGTIKSEYSAMYANKIRPAVEIYEEVYTEWIESE